MTHDSRASWRASMADFFDTSQIPDDAEYWAALATRVTVEAGHDSSATAFVWFAQSRVGWVAASILLAAALVLNVMSIRASPTTYRTDWVRALAPADDVGRSVVSSSSPPAIAALLLANPTGGER